MTFRIANNQIHIGWAETAAIITAIVGGVWATRAGYDTYIQNQERANKNQEETNKRLSVIENRFSIKNTTDSLQTVNIAKLFHRLDSALIADNQHGPGRVKKYGTRFFTEKWVNGHLQVTEVKQD
jgi:hypothetical protein